MDRLEMAKALMDKAKATDPGQTTIAYGTATTDSSNGIVLVNFDGDTISPDDEQAVEVETTFFVREGDEVMVSLIGADGKGKTPIVIGVIGRGDEQQTEIDTAVYLATEANGAASVGKITPQHFFYNSQGAFVTSDEVTCDTFNGDGVVTNFTLSGTPYNDTLLALYVAGASVISGYSVSGTVLTFDSAPSGSIVALWSAAQMQDYAKMDSDSFDIVKATDTVASFGREVTVGSRESSGAVGNFSQVFGQKCVASAPFSRASGFNNIAASDYQEVIGRNNIEDNADTYAFIVGNGDYPTETETFTTDEVTTSFQLLHSPETVFDFKVDGVLDLGNAIDGYDPIFTSVTIISGIVPKLVIKLAQALDYDLPLLAIMEDGNNGHSYKKVTIEAGETEVSITGNILGSITHLFALFAQQYSYGGSSFYGHVITDGYTLSTDTLTLTNEAAYWSQIFSGLTVTIGYIYTGGTTRSNAMTVDWNGNEHIAGEYSNPFGIAPVFKLLWVNSAPKSNFSAQTIPLNLSSYDATMVVFRLTTSNEAKWWQFGWKDGEVSGGAYRGTSYLYHRDYRADSNGVEFYAGYRDSTSGSSYGIPVAIYGIKGLPTSLI